jgi:N-acetylmuramate 1-kinase
MVEAATEARAGLIDGFLARHGWANAERSLLAADASFRSYNRLHRGDQKAVLMNAPPPQEDIRPFLQVDEILTKLGLSAPEILAADPEAGLILLEDFGDRTYTNLLREAPEREFELYALAVDVLIALHRRYKPVAGLPLYDEPRLLEEAALLFDWYLPEVNVSAGDRSNYLDMWRTVLPLARQAPDTLVLRDYHVDNLMLLEDRADLSRCGLLDFQDAVIGPSSYDLVSLLEDARRDVPPELARRLMDRYLHAFPALERDDFRAAYAVLGAQRSAKIIGIFTRLARRDGKLDYLRHIPRTWRWLEGGLQHPALGDLQDWFDRVIPAAARVIPKIEIALDETR